MIEFERIGRLETVDLAASGVDAAHHRLDGAVLPRRVERLKNNEKRSRVAREQPRLQLAHLLDGGVEGLLILIAIPAPFWRQGHRLADPESAVERNEELVR